MSDLTKASLPLLLAVTLVSACTSPVGQQASGVEVGSVWSRLTGTATPVADLKAPLASGPTAEVEQGWWHRFDDPVLDALVVEALDNNKTLQIAKARVEELRAGRSEARSLLWPDISGVAGAQRGNQGYATNNRTVSIADADLKASWELDLFGRNQARVAEATALLQSEEATAQGVRVGLLAELARSYFDLRNSQRQLDLTRQNVQTQKQTLDLIRVQMQGALASDFDVQRGSPGFGH